MKEHPVLIAGAGIAGLTAALALARKGFHVQVFEQATTLREVGAGLQLSANGTRLLCALGLQGALEEIALTPEGKEVRIWSTGDTRQLFDLDMISNQRYGYPYLMVHRADVHRVLADALEAAQPGAIELGRKLVGVTGLDAFDGTVTACFGDGDRRDGSALIGADGVHSTLRRLIFGEDRPIYTGCMAWRGLAKASALPESLTRRVGTNWIGPSAHVVQYPVRQGELINFVGIVERAEWTAESWTIQGSRADCIADYAGWHPDVLELIACLEDEPNRWGLMGREPMERWWQGVACLIGDACHPTLPFLAQGANMAVEDGFIMARCLERYRTDASRAFEVFQALRHERTSKVVLGSAENARRFHNPALADPAGARAYLDEQWSPDRVEQRYEWLFAYDGESVAV